MQGHCNTAPAHGGSIKEECAGLAIGIDVLQVSVGDGGPITSHDDKGASIRRIVGGDALRIGIELNVGLPVSQQISLPSKCPELSVCRGAGRMSRHSRPIQFHLATHYEVSRRYVRKQFWCIVHASPIVQRADLTCGCGSTYDQVGYFLTSE